ncbi:MAG: RidA family protein [Candidatus Melainabacteria bacterium]|nr:MAG: RidA family protein [Candidatus Melainabacteria bacterium]
MQFIETSAAPLPAGHYSQAVVVNGLVFVSGVLPLAPNTGCLIPQGIAAQATQLFENLSAVLRAAGSDLQQLVSIQLFIPDIGSWESVNGIYQKILGAHKPARSIIPCGPLHYGVLIEANAVAIVPAIEASG